MGSGFKDFAAGDVLTANDVDGYLMRQTVMTFADAAARDSALSGVLDEGMVAYLEDTDQLTFYTGSAWKNVVSATDSGLVLVKSVTITGNPATVAVTNVFNANLYTNYRVVASNLYVSALSEVRIIFGGTTTGYYGGYKLFVYTGTEAFAGRNNGANIPIVDANTSAGNSSVSLDIYLPNNATRTTLSGVGASDGIGYVCNGMLANSTAYTDFTLSLATGGATFTGGRIDVYGYKF